MQKLLLCVACFAFTLTCAEVKSSESSPKIPVTVGVVASDGKVKTQNAVTNNDDSETPRPLTIAGMRAWWQKKRGENPPYEMELDLNGDGRKEIFIPTTSPGMTGNGEFALFTVDKSGQEQLLAVIEGTVNNIEVLSTLHDGWRDFLIREYDPPGIKHNVISKETFSWNGSGYVQKALELPKDFCFEGNLQGKTIRIQIAILENTFYGHYEEVEQQHLEPIPQYVAFFGDADKNFKPQKSQTLNLTINFNEDAPCLLSPNKTQAAWKFIADGAKVKLLVPFFIQGRKEVKTLYVTQPERK